MVVQCRRAVALSITTTTRYNSFTYATLGFTFVSFTNRKVFPRVTALLHVNVQLVTRRINYYAADRYCSARTGALLVRLSVADTIHMQITYL